MAQACSSVMGALKLDVIFSNDKEESWFNLHGVQLVSQKLAGFFIEAMISKRIFSGCCLRPDTSTFHNHNKLFAFKKFKHSKVSRLRLSLSSRRSRRVNWECVKGWVWSAQIQTTRPCRRRYNLLARCAQMHSAVQCVRAFALKYQKICFKHQQCHWNSLVFRKCPNNLWCLLNSLMYSCYVVHFTYKIRYFFTEKWKSLNFLAWYFIFADFHQVLCPVHCVPKSLNVTLKLRGFLFQGFQANLLWVIFRNSNVD